MGRGHSPLPRLLPIGEGTPLPKPHSIGAYLASIKQKTSPSEKKYITGVYE